jgi:nitrite reductase/ring-hydroxylating ferredoxin subunit
MAEWINIAVSIAELFQDGEKVAKKVGGKNICFARWQDGVYAFNDKCPHAGGLLSHGYVDAMGNIVCPLHRYKFSLTRGYNVTGEGYHLKTYPVRIDEDGVWVEI